LSLAHASVKLWECICYSIYIRFVFCLSCVLVFMSQHYIGWKTFFWCQGKMTFKGWTLKLVLHKGVWITSCLNSSFLLCVTLSYSLLKFINTLNVGYTMYLLWLLGFWLSRLWFLMFRVINIEIYLTLNLYLSLVF
jgi:hypothetical protein